MKAYTDFIKLFKSYTFYGKLYINNLGIGIVDHMVTSLLTHLQS